ncbi:MAG: sugar phosphate isomerase/epimerase family protein [Candidatus Metalachnospira sp.]|nr:sugar phosphate isomerase/epimerase family protein [Candidatus Metalachnospira sp.]
MNPVSVGVWTYGMCTDRYVGEGYKPKMDLKERIEHIGKIKSAAGIEITYPGDINENNYAEFKPILDKYGLSISGMGVEIVCDKEWATGSLSSPVQEVREKAITLVKKAMDFAAEINVNVVSLWMGQDGFDYLFQTDYVKAWNDLVESLRECAMHNPSIKLGIEYKRSEPRLSCLTKSAGKTLALCMKTGCDNVGITMDIGHSFNAGENPAEEIALLMSENRLFHLHFNDNYIIADDDMPVGSVHFLHFAEMFFWLHRLGYNGWYSLDMYPYRDDPDEAVIASIKFMEKMDSLIEKSFEDYSFDTTGTQKPSSILNNLFDKIFA